MNGRNWFDMGGQDYARFRPGYPPRLAEALAGSCRRTRSAVDVGCGSGQFTVELARVFDAVTGVDPSPDQLAHAVPHDRVRYVQGPAERLPVPDGYADLVTAAQAAHWFDLPAFYAEARRIAAPGALLALIGYGTATLEPALQERVQRFYAEEIGPFWPPERALVDSAYRTLPFPYDELPVEPFSIHSELTLNQALGYFGTWSAVRSATEAGRVDLLTTFADDLTALWGDPRRARPIQWPVFLRLGALHPVP